jgi:hypothetical protein
MDEDEENTVTTGSRVVDTQESSMSFEGGSMSFEISASELGAAAEDIDNAKWWPQKIPGLNNRNRFLAKKKEDQWVYDGFLISRRCKPGDSNLVVRCLAGNCYWEPKSTNLTQMREHREGLGRSKKCGDYTFYKTIKRSFQSLLRA